MYYIIQLNIFNLRVICTRISLNPHTKQQFKSEAISFFSCGGLLIYKVVENKNSSFKNHNFKTAWMQIALLNLFCPLNNVGCS